MVTAQGLAGMPEFIEQELGALALSRAFQEAGLPANIPVKEGYFLPEVAVTKFLGSAARQAGDNLLGAKLGLHLNMENYGVWGRYVLEGETLLSALQRFNKSLVCFCNYSGFQLDLEKELTWFRFQFATSEHQDYRQVALASAGSFINLIRHYAGPHWLPEFIELNVAPPRSPSALEEIHPAKFRYNSEFVGITIPRGCLTLPRRAELPPVPTTFSSAMRARGDASPNSFVETLIEIIRFQVVSSHVSLDTAARSLDLGLRTIQRKLDQAGVNFRNLTVYTRMKIARELVVETQLPIASIAEIVGYTSPSNFSRAFQRSVGVSPTQFRTLNIK